MELNVVYNEDCLVGMQRIPDKSIDMILCDLPYGTTQNKWDSIIDLFSLWEQYERVIKNKGAIVLTAAQPFTSKLTISNLKLFKWEDVWDKKSTTGFLNAKVMPLRRHENILVFGKGRITYNPAMRKGELRKKGHSKVNNGCYGDYKPTSSFNDGYYPTSIVEISNANQRAKIHPTQKPVALFEYLIETYSNKGQIVLDNCMGSFTTAIACLNTGRGFIGFEKDEKYFKAGIERLHKHTNPQVKVIKMNGASQPEIHKEKMPTQQKQQMLLNL